MAEAKKKYQHTVEPMEAVEREGKTVVVARVCERQFAKAIRSKTSTDA